MPPELPRLKRNVALSGVLGFGLALAAFVAWQHTLKQIPAVQFPVRQLPAPNAFDTFIAAGKGYVAPAVPADALVDPRRPLAGGGGFDYQRDYPAPAREAWLHRNSLSLALARQGLNQPYLHPLYISPDRSFKHLDLFTSVANLLAVESHARRLRGDWALAAGSALDVLQFGAEIPRGAPLMAAYCGYRIQALGRHELWPLLPHLDAAATQKALNRLNAIETHRVDLTATLESEKWLSQATLLEIMQTGIWQRSFFQNESKLAFRWRLLKMNYPLILADNRKLFENRIRASQGGWQAREIDMPGFSDADPVMARIAPIYYFAAEQAAMCEAGNQLLRTSVALRSCYLKAGRYPQSLAALVPRYLKAEPVDPFSRFREPLRYLPLEKAHYKVWDYQRIDMASITGRVEKSSHEWIWRGKARAAQTDFKLYSVGPNGDDNAGLPSENKQISNAARYDMSDPTIERDDIVAGVNW